MTLKRAELLTNSNKSTVVSVAEFMLISNKMIDLLVYKELQRGNDLLEVVCRNLGTKKEALMNNITPELYSVSDTGRIEMSH